MTDPYQQAAQKSWETEVPKGKYIMKLANVRFGESNWDDTKGQPEISFRFVVEEEPYTGISVEAQIRPLDPAKTINGKTIPSGMHQLNKMLVCLGHAMPREEVTEESIKSTLIQAADEGAMIRGFVNDRGRVLPNDPIDPEQVTPTDADFSQTETANAPF